MFERFIEQCFVIVVVLYNNIIISFFDVRILELFDQVWKVIEDLVLVLKLFQVVIIIISGISFLIFSMVYFIVIGFFKNYLNVQGEDSIVFVKFKEVVIKDLLFWFFKMDYDLVIYYVVFMCVFDLCYKFLKFMIDEQRNIVKLSIEKFDI